MFKNKTITPTIILALATALLLSACKKNDDLFYSEDTGAEFNLYDYYIDNYGNEGIVAYVSGNDSNKYFIILSLDETEAQWGPTGMQVFNGSSPDNYTSSRFGLAMLYCMYSIGMERFPAQQWCFSKNTGETYPRAGSWRLPTYTDWWLIIGETVYPDSNIAQLNRHIQDHYGTPLGTNAYYWCCEEDYEGYVELVDTESDFDPENRAVMTTPLWRASADKDKWIKKNSHNVRAIKYIFRKFEE